MASAIGSTLERILRNPLAVYGMILVAGDGPLVTAYALTNDPVRAWWLMCAAIVFIFAMGGFFCYLVAFKPRHLYAPTEIPESAFDKSIYAEAKPTHDPQAAFDTTMAQSMEKLGKDLSGQIERLSGPDRRITLEEVKTVVESALTRSMEAAQESAAVERAMHGIHELMLRRPAVQTKVQHVTALVGDFYSVPASAVREALREAAARGDIEVHGDVDDGRTPVSWDSRPKGPKD